MKILKAKILDSNHLELEESINGDIGEIIQVVISEERERDTLKEKAKKNFFKMYSEEDNIYDEI